MKRRIIWGYVIIVHLLLGYVLLKSAFVQHVREHIGIAAPQAGVTEYYRQMLTIHSRMDGNVPDRSVIFIGDSCIQGLAVSAVANPSVNYGIGYDTTEGVLRRIPVYESIGRARAVVIAVGGNDMKLRSDEEILANMNAIFHRMSPVTPVIVSAILPRDEEVKGVPQGVNSRIRDLNSKLKGLSKESGNISFVDPSPMLVDGKGSLGDEFHAGDGVHLNSRGYSVWIKLLAQAIDHIGE